jgi:hypothetical protein
MNLLNEKRKLLPMGEYQMGGGGGGPSGPTQTNVTNTNIPEYAQPYVETMLGSAQQQIYNYDANGQPTSMKPYAPAFNNASDYFAGFSPMQQQAFQGASNLDAGPKGFQQNVGAYMSPYMQNVVDIQKRGAVRDAGIAGVGQQAQATQAGGFGGYREGVQRGEMNRNLMGQLGDIQAKGSQAAYDSAANQFRQGIGQQQSVLGMQSQMGAQQQGQQQNIINQQVQDYATGQQYPMMQLANMSGLLRGLPLQQATTQTYQAAPSAISQVAGLGTAGIAGLGLYNTMNKGA